MGALILRRRRPPGSDRDIFEISLGDAFLMSSDFTESEKALASLGLAAVPGDQLDVVVGGLGLGYTACEALKDQRVASLLVVDALDAVIDWHQSGLLPLGETLVADQRCRLVHGDFFAMASDGAGFDPENPGRRFDAILLDIDHSPDAVLAPSHASFYTPAGLTRFAGRLKPGGAFALWSNDPPDEAFVVRLRSAFATASAERVTFHNPLQDRDFVQTVYLATVTAQGGPQA